MARLRHTRLPACLGVTAAMVIGVGLPSPAAAPAQGLAAPTRLSVVSATSPSPSYNLTIERFTVRVQADGQIRAVIKVRNTGETRTNGVYTALRDNGVRRLMAHRNLPPGTSRTFRPTWRPQVAGEHRLVARTDARTYYAETDEDDNVKRRRLPHRH